MVCEYDEKKMMGLISKDAFLESVYNRGADPKVIFNTYVIGDSIQEREYELTPRVSPAIAELVRSLKQVLELEVQKKAKRCNWCQEIKDKTGFYRGICPECQTLKEKGFTHIHDTDIIVKRRRKNKQAQKRKIADLKKVVEFKKPRRMIQI